MERNQPRIRQLRETQTPPLKRQELAVEFGVDPTTVYRWETGATEIDDDTKRRLAKRFGVSIEHLMGWDRDDSRAAA